ncbi:NAD-dependent epimerase/dehydratase family protein [Sphingomonas sinipercae]|uniref:NAD-dependent epimerase/dehydratase family protein n=1 Tax=Sphingomonas sinipercae TaxID=2714944 RepID=A0A6G7ZKK9_9SPHN|nr:GDP-mannose 4,6-dehydratase [Sphingomonas sinipercae]QIL01459.1 NAD-dependent epimerase/dehydratase family protein [Sphingomonas sinipercae]
MKRILVTGVHGFTGQYLVPALRNRGFDVHGLLRPGTDTAAEGLVTHVADLTDVAELSRTVREVRPDAVIHLAGISFVAHSDPREIYDSNLIGSRNLLQAVSTEAAQCGAVILASSANVYGNQREGVLTEDTPPEPINEYGISKLAMELVAKLYMSRLPITIMRPFNYTGVGQSTDFVIPKIVDHARRRAPVIELGNLDVERDFSDVRSVVECYLRLLETPAARGRTLNICSGRGYTLRTVLDLVQELSGHRLQVRSNPDFVRKNEVKTLYGDNSRLLDLIGGLDMPPLASTLRWMIEA